MAKRKFKYTVWVQYDVKNIKREVVKKSWVERVDTDELEMARSLTQDVQRMGVAWQIRTADGAVVERWDGNLI